MTRWEYGVLDARLTSGSLQSGEYWAPWRFKGAELHHWQNMRFAQYLDELGSDGWELVGFSHSSPTSEYWVFKRPR